MESYLIESLRTWQAMSAYLSINVPITLTPNTVLFDLIDLVPEIAPSVTDRDLILDIQRALQEPTSATSWIGSDQFNYPQMVAAIQKRLDRFVLETGIRLSITEQAVAGNPVELDDAVIDVRRAMWKTDPEGIYSVMWKADPIQMAAYAPKWSTTSSSLNPPTDYTVGLQLPLTMEITPQPTVAGKVALLTVQSRPTLDPATTATILGIPDDLCWIIKYGALAEILAADGPGEDMARVGYCESRWRDGIQLARVYNTVRNAFINGNPAFIDPLSELDRSTPNWVNSLAGVPQFIGVAQNILAVSPITDNSNPSVSLDITPKFPVPALGDFVQVGKENLSVILDYAEHLAHFKEGMSEIQVSQDLLRNMLVLAGVQNDRIRAMIKTLDVMTSLTNRDKHFNTRRATDSSLQEIAYQEPE